jgi:hypothetical protein
MKKMTKKDYYKKILQHFGDDCPESEMIRNFLKNEIMLLDRKTESAKLKALEAKEKGDELREQIYDILPSQKEDFIPVSKIKEILNNDTITSQKISARLTQLFKLGKIEKQEISFEGQKRTGYRKI